MLKIDTHQHFWPYVAEQYPWMADQALAPLRRDFLPDALAPLLQTHGIAATVAVQARGSAAETSFLLDLAAQTPWLAGVVGWIDLRATDLPAQLQAHAAHHRRHGGKLVGFRHQVQDEADASTWLLRPEVSANLKALQQQQWVYELLFLQPQLSGLGPVVRRYDQWTLVLDHLGKPAIAGMSHNPALFQQWRSAIAPLRDASHVFVKLSGLVTEADWQRGLSADDWQWVMRCMDVALETVGPQRLLWGSDWPVCTLAARYAQVHEAFERWVQTRLSASEQALLWGQNALRCYGLEPPAASFAAA